MNIPENKNKVPDLLDEARWELEFELKMQVPEGEKLAGMVAPQDPRREVDGSCRLGPHEDPMPRFLQPPSTAATLNLAANAAQAARIWQKIDKAFADEVPEGGGARLGGGEGEPGRSSPPKSGDGGGPYDDNNAGRRLLLGGGGALHHDREGRVQGRRHQVGVLQAGRRRLERRPGHAHVDDLGRHAGAGIDLAGDRARTASARTSSTRSARTSSPSPTSTWT